MHSNFEVIAAVVTCRGRMALLRRSRHVTGDVGAWHCVTGFLPRQASPRRHAIMEIFEEAAIPASNLTLARYTVFDKESLDGNCWRVHAFHFESCSEAVSLNWENDASRWVDFESLKSVATVYWLDDVLQALQLPDFVRELAVA